MLQTPSLFLFLRATLVMPFLQLHEYIYFFKFNFNLIFGKKISRNRHVRLSEKKIFKKIEEIGYRYRALSNTNN